MSTRFLLSVLLAGASTDAFAIVRPRKAMIPEGYNGTTPSSSAVYGGGLPTTSPCTESTQTVTLSSVAPPPSITGGYPVNHGASDSYTYPPVTLTNSPSSSATSSVFDSSAAYPINTPTPGYGVPAEASLSNVGKQPATNTPIVPGGYGYTWPSSSNTTSWYQPTGTGYSGHLPEVISTSLTSESLIPYITSSSAVEYPAYPASNSASEVYPTQNAGVSVGYGVTPSAGPGYPVASSSSSAPPAYAASSSSAPPAYAASSSSPPAYGASSSTAPPAYAASSSSAPPDYAASSSSPPAYGAASSSSTTPPAYPAETPSAQPVYSVGIVSSIATPSPIYTENYGAPSTTVAPPVHVTSTLATSVASSSSSSAAVYGAHTPQPYNGVPPSGASYASYRA